MIDPHFLADNPDRVKDSLVKRHNAELCPTVDELVELAATRSRLLTERDTLRADRNRLSKEIGGLYRDGQRDEAEALKQRVQDGNQRIDVIETEIDELEARRNTLLMQLPNLIDLDTPEGETEDDNPVVRTWGEPRSVDFEIEAHVEICLLYTSDAADE